MGAVGVHGASAIWGLVAVGLFADGELPGIEVRGRALVVGLGLGVVAGWVSGVVRYSSGTVKI